MATEADYDVERARKESILDDCAHARAHIESAMNCFQGEFATATLAWISLALIKLHFVEEALTKGEDDEPTDSDPRAA